MYYQIRLKLCLILSTFILVSPTTFAALVINDTRPITHSVTVQPIVVSNNDGSNTATFFGNASQQTTIEGFIDQIWAQAGIDINFLAPRGWNQTSANTGATNLSGTVQDAIDDMIIDPLANVLNMFFVNVPDLFQSSAPLGTNVAAGSAFIDRNGITQYVGSNLLTFTSGLETIAGVVAHEIGHNLGLGHTADGIANLMSPGGNTDQLSENILQNEFARTGSRRVNQIALALGSPLAVEIPATAVPVPAAFWLFGSVAFLFIRQKKQPSIMLPQAAL